MGIQAAYMSVDDATLERLTQTEPEELFDAIEELEESGAPMLSLEKMWDGLHFLLTGVSASKPIEGHPLSESVVGVHAFESEDFIGCTEVDELPAVIAALDAVRIEDVLAEADFARFHKARLYPKIWKDDPALLKAELLGAFQALRAFHHECAAAKRHLLVSIY